MLPQWWVWRSPCKEPSCIVILASDGGGDDDGDDADVDNDDDNDDDDRNWVLSTSSGTFYMEPGFSLRNQPFHKTVPYITVKSFGVCYLFGKVGSLDLGGWAAGKLAVWLDLGKSVGGNFTGTAPRPARLMPPTTQWRWKQGPGVRNPVFDRLIVSIRNPKKLRQNPKKYQGGIQKYSSQARLMPPTTTGDGIMGKKEQVCATLS